MNTQPLILTLLLTAASVNTAIAGDTSEAMYRLLDRDANGKVTMKEFRNGGMDAEGMDWSEGLSTVCTEHTLKAAEKDLGATFEALDADNNKSISLAEFRVHGERLYNDYWRESFRLADSNKDNRLSGSEFGAQANRYIRDLEQAYQMNKIPTECKADIEYWSEYYQGMAQYVPVGFQYLDQNGDQQLSYDEYRGTHLWQ
jgi:Ca2+-binding EF-hand superfamily protein